MKKKIISVIMCAALCLSLASCGSGETKDTSKTGFVPKSDFNIRVPFAAGGAADTISRIIAKGLQKEFDKKAIVNNITGANGAIAANDLLQAKAEPTNIMLGGIAMFTLSPLFSKDINFNVDDFSFIMSLAEDDLVLFANKDQGITSFDDLKKYGEDHTVLFGSNAPGGATHMLATMLFGDAGIKAEAVSSDGSAKDLLALQGGNVNCAIANASLGEQYISEGKLVPIAVFSEEEYKGYEGITVPTVKSLGYDIVFKTCNFLMTKKGVSEEDLKTIREKIMEYGETDEFKELAKQAKYVPVFKDGEYVKKTIADTYELCNKAYEKYYKN